MTASKTNLKNLTFGLYRTERRSEGGYTHHKLFWAPGSVKSMQARLDGAIDNKAGYGSLDAARNIERESRALLAEGITQYWDFDIYGAHVNATYQLYLAASDGKAAQWCEPSFDAGSEARAIFQNAALIKRLTRNGYVRSELNSPDAMAAALGKLAPTYALSSRDLSQSYLYFIESAPRAKRAA